MSETGKLGKLSARNDPRTLRLTDYTCNLAPAPESCDRTSKMTDIGVMLNDSLGDCTCATVGHIIQQWTAESGTQVIVPDSAILALYEVVGGYVPGEDSTDGGAVAIDVLNFWTKNGIAGRKPLMAYAALNSKHPSQLRDAVYYFGNAYIGVELPLSAKDQDIWDVPTLGTHIGHGRPGSWGGHAIPVCAYDEEFVYVITWGAIKKMTWQFYLAYCDEAYACLSTDWINDSTHLTPENFALELLQSALTAIKEA